MEELNKEKTLFDDIKQVLDHFSIVIENQSSSIGQPMRTAIKSLGIFEKLYGRDSLIWKDTSKRIKNFRTTKNLEEIKPIFAQITQLKTRLMLSKNNNSKNVFLIHGQDKVNTLILEKMLREDFKLNPIIMMDEPGNRRVLLKKFEDLANTCSFAVALYTKDDIVKKNDKSYYQARPNVIFETGWFIGNIGLENVLILFQNGLEIFSDYSGISRIQFENEVTEKFKEIQNEFRAMNLI